MARRCDVPRFNGKPKLLLAHNWQAHNNWRDFTYRNTEQRVYRGEEWGTEEWDKEEREETRVPSLVGAHIMYRGKHAWYDINGVMVTRVQPGSNFVHTAVSGGAEMSAHLTAACKSNRNWIMSLRHEDYDMRVAYTARHKAPTSCPETERETFLGTKHPGRMLHDLEETVAEVEHVLLGMECTRSATRFGQPGGWPALIAVRLVGSRLTRAEVRLAVRRQLQKIRREGQYPGFAPVDYGWARQIVALCASPYIVEKVAEEMRDTEKTMEDIEDDG